MYELKYDFKQYNDIISTYMEILINNSMTSFQKQIRNGQIRNSEHDADSLAGCIQNFEEYLYYNYKKSPETFNIMLNSTLNDEATTQNRAENFVYEFSGKNRPRLAYYRNSRMIDKYKNIFAILV